MPNRMTALDASFLFMETASTPMHAGGVAVFTPPPGGFDHERLVRLIKQRIPYVPRYRQRIRDVPFGVARPVWVDDERFDVTYHVRRSALPKPGSRDQLNELVARLMSRPLDRSRPLWEMYLVEGLADGNFAIVSKSHQALVDGLSAVDIAQVMLDLTEEPAAAPGDSWRPRREPTDVELLSQAFTELTTRPAAAVEAVRDTVADVSKTAARFGASAAGHGLRGAGRRPALGGQPAERAHRGAAPLRDRRPVPGRPQEGSGCARRHGQRHRPGRRRGRTARLAPGARHRGGAGRRDEGDAADQRGDLVGGFRSRRGQSGVGDARRAAGGRGRSCGPAAADQLPARAARGGQPVRRRRLDRQHRRASHRPRSTPSGRASGRR